MATGNVKGCQLKNQIRRAMLIKNYNKCVSFCFPIFQDDLNVNSKNGLIILISISNTYKYVNKYVDNYIFLIVLPV
jgi:hypothetical protein